MRAIPRRLLPCTAVTAALTLVSGCGLGASHVESSSDAKERGPITYAAGKDPSGTVPKLINKWNATHPGEKAKFVELSADPNSQRESMIQNAQLKSDAYSVVSLDVVWTSEFAAHRWIDEVPSGAYPYGKTLGPINGTATYRGKHFAMPYASDGALLYYRKDLLDKAGVKKPPRTWAEMQAVCRKVLKPHMSCYGGQFEKYEGLTANFAEAVNTAGGTVTDAKGAPHLDTPQARQGLDFLVKGFRDHMMPKEAVTYMEEPSRRAFEKSKLLFLRNWPYQYALSNTKAAGNDVAGKFAVAPIPGPHGTGSTSLGGHNLALSSSAHNKATALDFMKFMTSERSQRMNLTGASLAPTFRKLYDDPKLRHSFPYLSPLKRSILGAKPRPRVVRYGDATTAVQDEVYAAITGTKTTRQALHSLQQELRHLEP